MVRVTRGYIPSAATCGHFLYKRIMRIYPLYWIYSAAVLVVYFFAPTIVNTLQNNQVNILSSFLLLPDTLLPLINVGWSLRHEMYFYIVFSLFLFSIQERYLPVAILCWGITVLTGWFFLNSPNAVFLLIFHPYTFEFILGTIVAFACNRNYLQLNIHALIVGGLLSAVPFMLFLWHEQSALTIYENVWWRIIFFGLPAAMIVYSCVSLEIIHKWVAPHWLISMGNASYSIYLTHVLVASLLGRIWIKLGLTGPIMQILFLSVIIVCCIGWGLISYHYIEKPLLDKSRQLQLIWNQKKP